MAHTPTSTADQREALEQSEDRASRGHPVRRLVSRNL